MRVILFVIVVSLVQSVHCTNLHQEIAELQQSIEYQTNQKNAHISRQIIHQRQLQISQLQLFASRHGKHKFILINVNEQHLRLYNKNQLILYERVIVGKPGFDTPTFTDNINQIIFNPRWIIPQHLSHKILSQLKNTPNDQFTVVDSNNHPIHPLTVNQHDEYHIIQRSGKFNMLGQFKFDFPNKFYGVYIHDTPHKWLFDRTDRRFSSGCIRVENPRKLVQLLLNMSNTEIDRLLRNHNYHVPIQQPVKVYIVNWRHWITPDLTIQYK